MGGTLLDCRVEKNFAQLEVSEEITKKNDKEKDIRNKKIKRNKKLKINNISHTTNNEEDDMIIINTDEEKSINDKENTNKNINKNKNNNNSKEKKNKKINNTIFINNSNVTISQLKEKKLKLKEELNSIKPVSNCFNNNEDNIELNELLNNVFNNARTNSLNSLNNKNFFTESDIDYNYNKEYFDQLYSEQSQIKLEEKNLNENDEKIIKKLNKLKEKINNKNKPKQKKNFRKFNFEFDPIKAQRTISMTNKQIKKNVPSYRKVQGLFNSISFNKNSYLNKFKGNKNTNSTMNRYTLGNSFNKSLYSSLMFDSVKEHMYNNSTNSNNLSNNIIDGYINEMNGHSRGTPSIYSMHKSYFNNSSINQTSSNGFNSQVKNQKRKSLYNVVTNKTKSKSKQLSNKAQKFKKNLMKIEIKKEIENNLDENDNNLLYHHYRDIIEIILPKNFHKDSIVDPKIYIASKANKNKAILNYNKLNHLNTSLILYDGILYKVSDKKNKGFKLSQRYFQILKNCFRYYNKINKEKSEEKPLVQFDIRHIKDLQIIDNDFLSEYKIDNKDIEMVFCIYLNQNDDFFVFAVNNENLGKSVFDMLNLLKNYYEDKK